MKYTLNIFIVINCVNMADQSPFTTRINFTGKKILEVLGMRESLVIEDCEIFLVMLNGHLSLVPKYCVCY